MDFNFKLNLKLKTSKFTQRTSTTTHKETNKRRRSSLRDSLKLSDHEQSDFQSSPFTKISNKSKRFSLANSSTIIHEVEGLNIQSPNPITTSQKEIESSQPVTEMPVKTSEITNSTTSQHSIPSETNTTNSTSPKVFPPSITSSSFVIPHTKATSTCVVPNKPLSTVPDLQPVVDVDSLQHNIYYMGDMAYGIFQYLKEREVFIVYFNLVLCRCFIYEQNESFQILKIF